MDRSKRSIQFDAGSAVTRRRFGAIAGGTFAAVAIPLAAWPPAAQTTRELKARR